MSGNSLGEQVTQLSRLKYSPQRKKPNFPPPRRTSHNPPRGRLWGREVKEGIRTTHIHIPVLKFPEPPDLKLEPTSHRTIETQTQNVSLLQILINTNTNINKIPATDRIRYTKKEKRNEKRNEPPHQPFTPPIFSLSFFLLRILPFPYLPFPFLPYSFS